MRFPPFQSFHLWLSVAIFLSSGASLANTPNPESRVSAPPVADELGLFKIPSQSLSSALLLFSETTGIDYMVSARLLEGKQTQGVEGEYATEQALSKLLDGTGLVFIKRSDRSYLLRLPSRDAQAVAKAQPIIEEIIVTSQRRGQPAQDIPLSVSVIGGAQLRALGKTNTRDLFAVAPSVSYYGAINSAGQAMRIRGVGSGVLAGGIEQSATTIVDDVVTGPSGSGLQELWDIHRIEILRGPQGTLFGKNVSAGAISQITNDPSEHFLFDIHHRQEFEYHSARTDIVLNGPLGGSFTGRLSGFYLDQDKGAVENIVRGETENYRRRQGVRGKLFYDADNFWAHLSISFDEIDDSCCARTFAGVDESLLSDFTAGVAVPAFERQNLEPSMHNRIAIADSDLIEQSQTLHSVAEFGRVLDSGHTLKLILGHRDWRHQSQNDADNLDLDLVTVKDKRNLHISSQELQWLSPEGGRWEYLLGLYAYQQAFPVTEMLTGGRDFNGESGLTTIDSQVDIRNIAMFGHSKYEITPSVNVFGGLRILEEKLDGRGQQSGDHWVWSANYPRQQASTRDSDFVGNLGAQYFWNPHQQVFFSINRGYKGSALDTSANSLFFRAPVTTNGEVSLAEDALLEPETVLSYELGTKNVLFNHKLLFNTTVFLSRFRDFQISAFDGASSSFRLTNAGVLESTGVEMEFQAHPWRYTRFNGSVAYTDARFKRFTGATCQRPQQVDGSCSAATGGQDLSGQRVNSTPLWQIFLQYQQGYQAPLGYAYTDISYAWRDDVIYDADLDPATTQKAFGLLNARVGIQFDNNVELAAFVNNATDEDYAVRIIDSVLWAGTYSRYPAEGRTMGLELSWFWE